MLQQPSYRPDRKAFKGRIGSGYHNNQHNCGLIHGQYGLRAMEGGRLTARQLEAARRALRRSLVHSSVGSAQLWTRQFPDIPVSSKPSEVGMGKGKGAVSYWAALIRPGHIIFEVFVASGGSVLEVISSLEKAKDKLPRRCNVVQLGS